ncbi:hypothetical protein [Streptomyces anandii]|uniref:hypothetical protein n=1 Tax=Streptomyces anandii TaxID=285454 RepID=UPI0036A11150
MGSFTTNLKFYKPASTEFVNVETHMNNNWKLADKSVRRLLEYEFVSDNNPDIYQAVERSRYYKQYSNSVMAYFPSQGYFYQDPYAYVAGWNKAGSLITPPYSEHPDFPVAWRIVRDAISPTTAEIEWTGAIWQGGSALPLNTNVAGVLFLPAITIPTTSKYFHQAAGNASSNFSTARVGIFSGTAGTADLQFKRYGAASGNTSDENRIELTGIKYCVEVTG